MHPGNVKQTPCRNTPIALVRVGGPVDTNIYEFGVGSLQSGGAKSRKTDLGSRKALIAFVARGGPEYSNIDVFGVVGLQSAVLRFRATDFWISQRTQCVGLEWRS